MTTAEPRWKVACINWGHPDAPHATSYLLVRGEAKHIAYHPTWEMAMERVLRVAPWFHGAKEAAR